MMHWVTKIELAVVTILWGCTVLGIGGGLVYLGMVIGFPVGIMLLGGVVGAWVGLVYAVDYWWID